MTMIINSKCKIGEADLKKQNRNMEQMTYRNQNHIRIKVMAINHHKEVAGRKIKTIIMLNLQVVAHENYPKIGGLEQRSLLILDSNKQTIIKMQLLTHQIIKGKNKRTGII